MINETHLHKVKLVKVGVKGYKVLKCTARGCKFFINPRLAEGREFECYRCGNPYVYKINMLSVKKPHCNKCTKHYHRSKNFPC